MTVMEAGAEEDDEVAASAQMLDRFSQASRVSHGNLTAQDFPVGLGAPRATSCMMPSCAEAATI
jgi:hypothetical protein